MPVERIDLQNAFETTLTTAMGATDLTAQVASVGALATPCILVIEPDSDTQREFILFDGTFGGSAFVTTVLGNRYLEGSAQGSGLVHPTQSIVASVMTSHHVNALYDQIDASNDQIDATNVNLAATNDDVAAANDEIDATNAVIAALDHGADLAGLGDDDHTQYFNIDRGDARYSLLGHSHGVYLPIAGGTLTGALIGTTIQGDTVTATGGMHATGYYFEDPDSWIQSHEVDNAMSFYIDNGERMRLNNAGNLGIAGTHLYFSGVANTADYVEFDDTQNFFRIVQDGSETFRVDNAGNVHLEGSQIFLDAIGGNDYLQMPEASNYFRVVLDGTERFRVDGATGALYTGGGGLFFGIGSNDYIAMSEASNYFQVVIDGTERLNLAVQAGVGGGAAFSKTMPYGCDAWYSGAQTYSDSVWADMLLNDKRYDPGSDLSGTTFTIPTAGFYAFGAMARISGDAYQTRIAVAHSSGTSYEHETSGLDGYNSVFGARYMAAGETLKPRFFQNSTGSMATVANTQRFWVARLS